jgi:hypothetical protein
MMVTLYLRTETEAEMAAALPWLRGQDRDGAAAWIGSSHDYALAVIGPMGVAPVSYDAAGRPLAPPAMDARYHLNLRCASPEAAARIPAAIRIPPPATPKREFQ